MSKENLPLWKGREVYARQAVKRARQHFIEMRKAQAHAKRKVRQLEKMVLVGCLMLMMFVSGCGFLKGVEQMGKGAYKDVAWIFNAAAKHMAADPNN